MVASTSSLTDESGVRRRAIRIYEGGIRLVLQACALLSVLVTAGIVLVLLTQAMTFFTHVSLGEFLFGTKWSPLYGDPKFGVLPLVCGTAHVAVGSSLIALPLGIGSALFLSEYASHQLRSFVKPIMEILAGVPTVVYGFFALTVVTPFMRTVLEPVGITVDVFNVASASVVVGIMILPLVASLCDDAFGAVPRALREGAYGLGATKFEVATQVVFPAALSGVTAAFVLAVSRAVGETMAVTLAAGQMAQITANPFQSIETMTAYIVNVSLGDTPHGSIAYQTIFAVGLLLFVITLALNVFANLVLRKYREVYE